MGKKLVPKPNPNDLNSICYAIAKLDAELNTGASPIFAGISLSGLTASRLAATDASKVLVSSDLYAWVTQTANQVLIADDGDGTITFSIPQDIHTGASPTFDGGTFTSVVTGILPTAGEHLATKEYVDLALGTSKTFFLSDTASGIGALNYSYPHETGEASSTITPAAMGLGDGQLVKGYITEAGEPGTTTIHSGVIAIHLHAKKGNSNQRTTVLYAVISRVDADGTSNKTTVSTSEISAELTDAEAAIEIHTALAADIEILSTARLICDIYANVGTGAQNSAVTLYMEGTEDSYFTTQVDSGIWQNYGPVLDDLNTVGQVGANSEFLVGTGAGTFAWESGATVRTSLGLGIGDTPEFTSLDIGSTTYAFSSIQATGSFAIKTSGDNSDYLYISTVSDVPTIGTVGSCNLKITSSSGEIDFDNENLTTSGHIVSTGGGQTGRFLTGDAGNTVFAFSGDNFDIRAGTGGSSSQNVMRVTSAGNTDIKGTLASGVITQSGTTLANTYQPLDAELTSLAALSYASASFVKMTGAGTFALRTIGETADDLEGTIVHDNLASVHQDVTTSGSPTFAGLKLESELFIKEQAAADSDQADYGQFWVKDVTPNQPYFTDDSGVDHQLRVAATSGTITLLQADSSAQKQAKIDAVPRYIPDGITVTFQFETGGTHTETATLFWTGFYGGGVINIQGNTGEANATDLHTTQDTILDFTTNAVDGLFCQTCRLEINITNLKIVIQDSGATSAVAYASCFGIVRSLYNYLLGEGAVTTNYGILNNGSSTVNCTKTYFSNTKYGFATALGMSFSKGNDETGTDPTYGLYAYNAGIIGKRGTQPDGSTANERIQYGGVIR